MRVSTATARQALHHEERRARAATKTRREQPAPRPTHGESDHCDSATAACIMKSGALCTATKTRRGQSASRPTHGESERHDSATAACIMKSGALCTAIGKRCAP